jgi:hypothetical protein
VPVGTHKLKVEIPNQIGYEVTQVPSADNTVTDLGVISICRDSDNDTYTEDLDCNDSNPSTNPNAEEICNGRDDNCDNTVDEGCDLCTDGDDDGFYAQFGCGTITDCDDGSSSISPTAPENCNELDDDCDAQVDEGFDLQTDVDNCGSCGEVCSFPNAGATCESGLCQIGGCYPGYDDCEVGVEGCETDIDSDPSNCGSCNYDCGYHNNAYTGCFIGQCDYSCIEPWESCDGPVNDGNGCETDVRYSAEHCGFCNNPCNLPNAIEACVGSGCVVASCESGWGNCDGSSGNGCEQNLSNDVDNCGGCGVACGLLESCINGNCTLYCLADGNACTQNNDCCSGFCNANNLCSAN